MKIVFILVLCLSQALGDPFALLASKIDALKNPEDGFVGVVKGQAQASTETITTKSGPEAEVSANQADTAVVQKTTTTTTNDNNDNQVPSAPIAQPLSTSTTTTNTDTTTSTITTNTGTNTGNTGSGNDEVPLEGNGDTTTTHPTVEETSSPQGNGNTTETQKDSVSLEGNGDTAVVHPSAEDEAAKKKEDTTATDEGVLEKLKDLKERVEKLEQTEETQKSDGSSSSTSTSTSTSTDESLSSDNNYVNTANGPAPKVYDGNGLPQPGQIIGVSPFGVAKPLIGVGAADPRNKQKYNSIPVQKALNTDTKAIATGKGIAEQAEQAHKDFLDENTEEFERIMSWLQEQQHLLPKQHQPPKLLFEILKERIMLQQQKVLSQMLEKQQTQQQQPNNQQQPQLLQKEKSQKLAVDSNKPAPGQGTVID